jgi:uracil-DNA glycosylase
MGALYSSRVVPCFAGSRTPKLLLVGEAPGPRGANRTGFPFWGDDSGLALYGLIEELGLLHAPLGRWKRGADLSGTQPPPGDYAITNACPQMPLLADGGFCAPEPERLVSEAPRIASELATFAPQVVLSCGKAAAFALANASKHLGIEPPEALGRKLASIKLTAAMEELASSNHPWMLAGARALVTCHPARGQWSPSTPTGVLHARIVAQLRRALE